jgi:hypothetical protein
MTVTESLTESLNKAVEALLSYDRYYKRIMNLPQDFKSKLEIFKMNCMPRYKISPVYSNLIQDLNELKDLRKTSKMEFTRKDKYVLTQDNFSIKTLNYQKVKEYLNLSKSFLEKINSIIKNVKT